MAIKKICYQNLEASLFGGREVQVRLCSNLNIHTSANCGTIQSQSHSISNFCLLETASVDESKTSVSSISFLGTIVKVMNVDF